MTEEINHYERAKEHLASAGEMASSNPVQADRLLLVAGVHARLAQAQALDRIGLLLEQRLQADRWHGISPNLIAE